MGNVSYVLDFDSLAYWYQNRLLRSNVVAELAIADEAGMLCRCCWVICCSCLGSHR